MAEPSPRITDPLLLTLFLTTSLAWGGNYIFVLVGLQYTSPLWLASLRAGIGFVGVLIYMLAIRHTRVLDAAGRRDALLLGLPTTAIFLGFWFVAASQVPAGEAAVIIYTFPLWVALLSPWVLHHRLTSRHWAAVAIGFGGVILISQPWAASGQSVPPLALVELLAAAVSWAVGTVLFQRRFRGVEAMREANLFQLGGGALALFAATLVVGPLAVPDGPAVFWVAVLWISIFGTSYAYVAWYVLLAHVQAVTLATYTFLVPLVALALGTVFLGERLSPIELVGIFLVIAGVYTIGTARDRPTDPRAPAPPMSAAEPLPRGPSAPPAVDAASAPEVGLDSLSVLRVGRRLGRARHCGAE